MLTCLYNVDQDNMIHTEELIVPSKPALSANELLSQSAKTPPVLRLVRYEGWSAMA